MHIINVAKDFSTTPGARYRSDGPFSGEEFRERLLKPLFEDSSDNSKIRIVLDGVEGYATSFLEEAFGGLAREFGKQRVLDRLEFVSGEDSEAISEILDYIADVSKS
jgi:hypothetical protein